jgi:hypothetical protein
MATGATTIAKAVNSAADSFFISYSFGWPTEIIAVIRSDLSAA